MKVAPMVIVGVVVVVFLAVGGFLLFGRGGGGGEARTLDVTVTGDTMSPSGLSVHEHDRVTLSFTIDKPEEVHLHGYDIIFSAEKAGDKVTRTFTADKTGDFEIEIEDRSKQIGSLKVDPR